MCGEMAETLASSPKAGLRRDASGPYEKAGLVADSQAGGRRVHQLRAVGPAPCAPTLTASGAGLWRPPMPSSSYKRGGGTSQVGWTRTAPRVECRLER
jgi:hypothetical protein